MMPNSHIIHLKTVDSTNSYTKELKGIDEMLDGTIFWTDDQTKGKGRGKNVWMSEKGKNLMFSMIVHPFFLRIEHNFYLSKMISLALIDFFKKYINNVRIKWPNDIYVDDKKIAGILIVNKILVDKIQNSILGVGININQQEFSKDLPNPISLNQLTGKEYNIGRLVEEVKRCIDFRYGQLKSVQHNKLDEDYDRCLYKKNEVCRFNKEGISFKAIIKGVTTDGYLNVYTEGGEDLLLDFGEVSFEL